MNAKKDSVGICRHDEAVSTTQSSGGQYAFPIRYGYGSLLVLAYLSTVPDESLIHRYEFAVYLQEMNQFLPNFI